MKLYLSSFRVGDRSAELAEMCSGRRIGLIPNAMDDVAPEPRAVSNDKAIKELVDLGIDVEVLDLRDYFGDQARLEAILANLGGVWVRGGNTFVLRQAMKLSGFDGLLAERVGTDFFYGGYSAGICVLAPSLVGLGQVDHPQAVRGGALRRRGEFGMGCPPSYKTPPPCRWSPTPNGLTCSEGV